MVYCLVVAALVVLLDQISKIIVVNGIALGENVTVIEGVLNFTFVENRGAAFGMLSEHRWVFMVMSVLAIIGISLFLWKEKPKSFWIKTPLAFVLGGGVGNMIDRTFRGSVVDFIEADFVVYPEFSLEGGLSVTLRDFPIFNVADCFITVGCVALICYLLFCELPAEIKKEKAKSAVAENASTNAENDTNNDE